LETGEVLLGNGKIIGSRALKYLYKQRYRFPDSRESVVVNKIALEYRKIKAITNGTIAEEDYSRQRISQEVINHQIQRWKKIKANDLKIGMKKGKVHTRPAQ
jgi:hypothetical protein